MNQPISKNHELSIHVRRELIRDHPFKKHSRGYRSVILIVPIPGWETL